MPTLYAQLQQLVNNGNPERPTIQAELEAWRDAHGGNDAPAIRKMLRSKRMWVRDLWTNRHPHPYPSAGLAIIQTFELEPEGPWFPLREIYKDAIESHFGNLEALEHNFPLAPAEVFPQLHLSTCTRYWTVLQSHGLDGLRRLAEYWPPLNANDARITAKMLACGIAERVDWLGGVRFVVEDLGFPLETFAGTHEQPRLVRPECAEYLRELE